MVNGVVELIPETRKAPLLCKDPTVFCKIFTLVAEDPE